MPLIWPRLIPALRSATTHCRRRGSSFGGTTNSRCHSIPIPRASFTTRHCPPSRPRPRTSARCAGRSSARCASPPIFGHPSNSKWPRSRRNSSNTATRSIYPWRSDECFREEQRAMAFLPLSSPGQTPLRVLTIAGSDSGGGAGIQADLRTFALLGIHALVAVTAVTVQNSLSVKGFHEIPVDVVAGQIEAVASDIGVQAAKTGMLASAAIIDTVADTWVGQGLADTVPLIVDPVCATTRGEPLLHPSALNALKKKLFPLATVVTPNLDEVRLITGIEVVDAATQRTAARELHALGRQWALVKGGHLRSSTHSLDLLFDGTEFYEFDSPRIDTGNDHGAGDSLAAATASALAHGYPVPDAVAFAKRWVTECLRAAYPLGHGHGPVSALFRLGS